jgi:inositol phosphorylceramide mannosyltransferase catalytic subunit
VRVPRSIHQVWIGPDPLPDEQQPWIESWRRHHPGWEHRLWTEDDLPGDPFRREVLERLRAPVERADILRLEILFRHGGVYVDTDLECLRPLDDVLGDDEFVGVCLKPGRVTNTFMASAPGHPLLERALRELKPMETYWTMWATESIKEVAGPPLLRRLVPDYPDVTLLEPPLFFPSTPEQRERAVAVHHMARVWHNATALRTAMLKAEERLEIAKTALEKEKRRHAATQKRVAKLEERLEKGAGNGGIREKLDLLRRLG